MEKRIFIGTVKCGFCHKELTSEDICEYIPNRGKHRDDLDEEQCPYCGYHNTFIEDEYEEYAKKEQET